MGLEQSWRADKVERAGRECFIKRIKLWELKALEARARGRGRALKDTAAELAGVR